MKLKSILFYCLILLFSCASPKKYTQITDCSVERFSMVGTNFENLHPRFSWKLQSDYNGMRQEAYQILVSDSHEQLDPGNCWNTGKIESERSQLITYVGTNLKAGNRYFWKVKVWDQQGNESPWSEINSFQIGLPEAIDWNNAHWIAYDEMAADKRVVVGVTGYGDLSLNKVEERAIVPMFRKSFELRPGIESATLFISGIGQYEASINGQKVGDDFLTPGWTNYDKSVFYNTYDITQQLNEGENAIGVLVGNGFHYNNRERYRKVIIAYGFPKLICKMIVRYKDGIIESIVSDNSWQVTPSPITYSSIYGGEDYDARLAPNGWDETGFDASGWQQALLVQGPAGKLTSDKNFPVRVMETFDPISVKQLNDSTCVYDFGQNASGIVSFKVKGHAGQQVKLYPAEVLNDDGTISQRGSGPPYYYTYIIGSEEEESWQPRFTYYGLRYVQVVGAIPKSKALDSDLPEIMELKSLHTRNSTPSVGSFECSNELFNRTFELINWAIKSNLQSVLTDCPTREKLGWIEQDHLMGKSVHFNYDMYHLYCKLVDDLMEAQLENGLVPNIVPEYINFEYYDSAFRDSPEWGIATFYMPWVIYKWYGDASVMKKAWPMMESYLNYLVGKSKENILSHGLGDWYDIGPEPPGYAQLTPVPLVATATFYADVQMMAKIADALGKQDKKNEYQILAENIKKAFNERFYDVEKGVYATGSQTSFAMPLSLGLVPHEDEEKVYQNMIDSINANDKAITAGDIGFHYLIDILTRHNASDLIYEMNNRDDVPGYGYQLKKGATALAESWMALDTKSLNHLMLGHIMEWFYEGLGGIRQEETSTAYKNLIIYPEMVEGINYAKVSYQSVYGIIVCNWEKRDGAFILHLEVPANSTAKVYLPFDGEVSVTKNGELLDENIYLKFIANINGRPTYETQSGTYDFYVH